jgi:hypothetical protein
MAGQPAAPQLAISDFSTSRAASAHRSQKNRWPAAQNQNLHIPLRISLAVEGLCACAVGPSGLAVPSGLGSVLGTFVPGYLCRFPFPFSVATSTSTLLQQTAAHSTAFLLFVFTVYSGVLSPALPTTNRVSSCFVLLEIESRGAPPPPPPGAESGRPDCAALRCLELFAMQSQRCPSVAEGIDIILIRC